MDHKQKQAFKPSPDFQVFYKIYAKRKLGAVATCIIISLSFLQLNVFLFQSFLALTTAEGDFIDAINTLTSYLYTTNLIDMEVSYYLGVRYVLFVVSIIYFLLFLGMRWAIIKNRPIKSLEQIFDFLNLYFTTLILLPTTEMAYRELVCDELIMDRLDQKCAQGLHIFVIILAIFGFISALIMTVITVFYSLNGIYDKKNHMSGENRFWEGIVSTVKISVAIIMANDSDSRTFLVVYLAVQLAFSLILLAYFMFCYPYNKIITENALLLWLSVYFSQALSFLVYTLIDQEDLTSGYIFIMVLVISTPSLYYLYQKLKVRLLNKKTATIRDFLLKVQQLLQLKQVEKANTFEEMEFRGIIARHITHCTNAKCFCKDHELFDPKKQRYVELEKWHSNKSLMLKYYVRAKFEECVKSNPLHPDLLISYAEFLFEKFRNTHLALYQIMKVAQSNKFLHPYHRFKIYKLKYKISDYINVQNAEALDKTIEIESVIFVEEQLDRVINGMRDIITNSIGFWSYLVNKDLDLDKLSVLVQKMNNSVENTEKLWIPLKGYLRKQKKLMYFYNWFLKDFLHKRIILSEEEIDELFDNETFSVYSGDFMQCVIRDDNIIYQEESAIIHMSGNANDLGKIIKTNRTAAKMFGYAKDELERSHINMLMPKIIAEKHNSYLESYIHTGKGQVLYNQRKTFAKDRDGFIMPMWIVVKQLDNPDGLVQYAGLLRPFSQKKDEQNYYILLNNFGEINGISRNLSEHLKLPGDVFHKKLVNVVLLAPKLIKYLYFARLLQDEKEKRVNDSEEIDAMLINKIKETKKESKFAHIVRRSDKSPFMTSSNKVSTLKEFIDLDNLKIDGLSTMNKIDGERSPRDDEALREEINQNFENKEIEFTLRLPQKLNAFLKEFHRLKTKKHELLNNQQLIISAIESKDLLKKAIQQSETNQKAKIPLFFQGRKRIAMHLASYKHAVDSYVEALRTVSNHIARSGKNNVYRIKGVIVTDQYGPDKDMIKYIKIKEIVKKQEKFTNYQYYGSDRNIIKSEGKESTSFLGTLLDRGNNKSKFFKQDPSKTIKASPFKNSNLENSKASNAENQDISDNDIPKEGENGSPNVTDFDGDGAESPASNSGVKQQQSEKSLNKEEDEDDDKKSGDSNESMKQMILNELKNNLLAPFQSIYQKEENLQIDSNFRSLNNVKWFIRILFLTIIPLNIGLFFAGANVSLNQLDHSIDDIHLNEYLRKDYIRAHDAIITLILHQSGALDNLSTATTDQVDELIKADIETLKNSYSNILGNNSKNEWTNVLYEYIPKVQDTTSVDYEGVFSDMTIDAENSIQKLTNSLSEIVLFTDSNTDWIDTNVELQFYRANSFEKFNTFLTKVTFEIFRSLESRFSSTKNLSGYILIVEAVIFLLSLLAISRLIFLVIQSLKEILTTFTAIENPYLRETQRYYQRLRDYLEASKSQYINEEIEGDFFKKSTRDLGNKENENKETRYQKKFKTIESKNFMKKSTIKILGYYIFSVVLSCCLTVLFHLQTVSSLNGLQDALNDGQTFLKLNPSYIMSLISLKELLHNRTFYSQYDLPHMGNIIQQLENSLNRTLFKTDLEFVLKMESFLDGTPCETFKDSLSTNELKECQTLVLSKLSTGLITFHNYYGDFIIDTLMLQDDERFGLVDLSMVYEFGQLIKIIDSVFMGQSLESWKSDMNNYLSSKERLLIILIVVISVLNVLVFFGAEYSVVGTLNERFLLYRKIFNKYMLGDVLQREKRIKSRLVKYKLLNK